MSYKVVSGWPDFAFHPFDAARQKIAHFLFVNTRKHSRPNESSIEERAQWELVRAATQARRDAARAIAAEPLPDNSPDLWEMSTPVLLDELARIRGLALALPVKALSGELPLKSVVDALWNLETLLRDVLRVHGDCRSAWARRHAEKADASGGRSGRAGRVRGEQFAGSTQAAQTVIR